MLILKMAGGLGLAACFRRGSSLARPFMGWCRPSFPKRTPPCLYSTSPTEQGTYARFTDVQVGGEVLRINTTWLRENCMSEQSFNHDTQQRITLFYQLSDQQTAIKHMETEDGSLRVSWEDGHKSEYSLEWLKRHVHPGKPERFEKTLWTAKELSSIDLPRVDFQDYLQSEEALKEMLQSLLQYGIGLVDNVPADIAGTQQTAERLCFVQETLYGQMWSFTAEYARARSGTGYANMSLGAHIDTTYLSLPAGLIVFHFLHHDGTGGESLLVDGFRAAEDLRSEDPTAFDLLCKHRINFQYTDSQNQIDALNSIIKVHPVSKALEMVRYNHYDRSPIRTIPHEELPAYYSALARFSQLMTRESGEYWLKLGPGTMLFLDNWRVLHGRASFTGNRKVCGCYLPRDDWMGRARLLGLI